MRKVSESFDKTWLVIPTADRHKYLDLIFQASGIPAERRVLIRTKPGENISGALNLTAPEVFNIQSWWKFGINHAKAHGAEFVAVLNDDTDLQEGQLEMLLNQMVEEGTDLSHPDPSKDKGWGHCFLIRCDSNLMPDERFVWWCGDHDLEMQASKNNGVSISSFTVTNLHSNEYTSQNSNMKEIIDSDIAKFRKKYPIHTLCHDYFPRVIRKLSQVLNLPTV
jgi:hypothetical protein